MKKLSIIVFAAVLLVCFSACNNTKTYSQLQDEEQILIKDYIKNDGIVVVTALPDSDKWTANTYYKSSSGLYFNLSHIGDTAVKVKPGFTVSYRYAEYTLMGDTTKISFSTTQYKYPDKFIFGDYTSGGFAGLQEAVKYMKYLRSEARIIVPHNLNSSGYLQTVQPMGYHIRITGIN